MIDRQARRMVSKIKTSSTDPINPSVGDMWLLTSYAIQDSFTAPDGALLDSTKWVAIVGGVNSGEVGANTKVSIVGNKARCLINPVAITSFIWAYFKTVPTFYRGNLDKIHIKVSVTSDNNPYTGVTISKDTITGKPTGITNGLNVFWNTPNLYVQTYKSGVSAVVATIPNVDTSSITSRILEIIISDDFIQVLVDGNQVYLLATGAGLTLGTNPQIAFFHYNLSSGDHYSDFDDITIGLL